MSDEGKVKTTEANLRSRRDLLRAGGLGVIGLSLARRLRAEGAAGPQSTSSGSTLSPIKSCILIFYYGGPSHIDLWDMKPDAPSSVRGEFKSIATRVPGVQICEHLPGYARVMDRVALIRSLHHGMRDHNAASVEALCGRAPPQGDVTLLADDANSYPSYGALVSYLMPKEGRVPPHVTLPHVMYRDVKLPGQSPGFLGSAYGPFQVLRDPNSPDFRVAQLELPEHVSLARLENRWSLLRTMSQREGDFEQMAGAKSVEANYERALGLLRSEALRRSFDISQEDPRTRDRYGRNKHGQSVLLARRLVESGVRFVNVNNRELNGSRNWDTHFKNFGPLKDSLLPPADLAFSALIEDLETRGLLDSTLVIAMGEFGRTPQINKHGARDHWPYCYSAILAGGGIRGGAVLGSSDKWAAYPVSDPVTPGDLAATLFWRFGLDHTVHIEDLNERPHRLAGGEPLRTLFG
jgi:hypothetical protein